MEGATRRTKYQRKMDEELRDPQEPPMTMGTEKMGTVTVVKETRTKQAMKEINFTKMLTLFRNYPDLKYLTTADGKKAVPLTALKGTGGRAHDCNTAQIKQGMLHLYPCIWEAQPNAVKTPGDHRDHDWNRKLKQKYIQQQKQGELEKYTRIFGAMGSAWEAQWEDLGAYQFNPEYTAEDLHRALKKAIEATKMEKPVERGGSHWGGVKGPRPTARTVIEANTTWSKGEISEDALSRWALQFEVNGTKAEEPNEILRTHREEKGEAGDRPPGESQWNKNRKGYPTPERKFDKLDMIYADGSQRKVENQWGDKEDQGEEDEEEEGAEGEEEEVQQAPAERPKLQWETEEAELKQLEGNEETIGHKKRVEQIRA
eukprot:gene1327-biopygen1168